MDRVLLLDAVRQLETLASGSGTFARSQGVRQFNALLANAKAAYPDRVDMQAIEGFEDTAYTDHAVYSDAVKRLRLALELSPPGAVAALLEEIQLPDNVPPGITRDLAELREAAAIGLAKTVLLLSGLIAEALLLSRHPDSTERGPGLGALVRQARQERLLGRDTLRHLETLVDYRDLIHPRAEVRYRIEPNQARIESALAAVKLLCADLAADDFRFG
jgi:hypothetical protein